MKWFIRPKNEKRTTTLSIRISPTCKKQLEFLMEWASDNGKYRVSQADLIEKIIESLYYEKKNDNDVK